MVTSAANSTARGPQTGYTRGVIHVFGYIAFALENQPNRIKVFNIMCADPSGSIPKWVIDAGNADSCKTLATIRQLCEEAQQQAK